MGLHPVWPAGFCPLQKQEGDCCDALHVSALRHQQTGLDRAAANECRPSRPRGDRGRSVLGLGQESVNPHHGFFKNRIILSSGLALSQQVGPGKKYEHCVFCLLEGFLFVMGGTDEHKSILDSGEKYDPDSNTWSPIPPMLQVCSPLSVSALWLISQHLQSSLSYESI